MATRDAGSDPLQQFIAQYMQLREFTEMQRQFGAQQALAQRQIDNQEINQFAELAASVEAPEQRQALARQFATRVPHMAETFARLAETIPVSEQVYRARLVREGLPAVDAGEVASVALTGQNRGQAAVSGAMAAREQEDITAGIRIGEGQELSAGQRVQAQQFAQNLMENIRQFGVSSAQRDRQLGIAEFEAAQRGELGRMSTMFGAGFGGYALRGEQSQELRRVQEQLQNPALTPEGRRALQERAQELESSITDLNRWIEAQLARGQGADGGMNLNQLLQAEATAYDDVVSATSPGEREVATQRFNYIRALLRGGNPPPPESLLGQNQNFFEKLLQRAGESQLRPFDFQNTGLPFLPSGAR